VATGSPARICVNRQFLERIPDQERNTLGRRSRSAVCGLGIGPDVLANDLASLPGPTGRSGILRKTHLKAAASPSRGGLPHGVPSRHQR
jgi:hypothetical protein